MLTVYGIKSCDTCRKARKFLTEHHIEHRFRDVRDAPLNIQTLERWCDRIGWEKLLNRRSLTWRKVPEVDRRDMTRSRAIGVMLEHPTVITRPVLEADHFFAVGFSEERFSNFLNQLGR